MLLQLPNELLIEVAGRMQSERGIQALVRVNQRFFRVLDPYLYRRNAQESELSALFWAVENNRVRTAQKVFEYRPHRHNRGLWATYCGKALLLASLRGRSVFVRLLLSTGVDVNYTDTNRRTSLSMAAENGHENVVEMLLKAERADPNLKDIYGEAPLFWAIKNSRKTIVRLLLNTEHIDVNSKDVCGWTPLTTAANGGHEAIVRLLLGVGMIEVDQKNVYGETPLWLAAANGHVPVVKALLNTGGAKVSSEDVCGWTPRKVAIENDHQHIAELLFVRQPLWYRDTSNEQDESTICAASVVKGISVDELMAIGM